MLLCLKSFLSLNSLDLKHLTWKVCTLLALTTAATAQTLVSLSVNNMCVNSNGVVFNLTSLLKNQDLEGLILFHYKRIVTRNCAWF